MKSVFASGSSTLFAGPLRFGVSASMTTRSNPRARFIALR